MFLPDQAAALDAVRRLSRAKGTVVVRCWDRLERAPFAGLVAEALCAQLPADRGDLLRPFSLSDPQSNVAVFSTAGFSEVRITLETHVSRFTAFSDDFWEPIEAGVAAWARPILAFVRKPVKPYVLPFLSGCRCTRRRSHSHWNTARGSSPARADGRGRRT